MFRMRTISYYARRQNSTKPRAISKENFNVAVKAAEKVVGYPTSFLNLRWLLNDEIANIASNITKLINIQHPLINTARGFLFKNDVPTWGLVVLLVSKSCGLNKVTDLVHIDQVAGILHSQRILAEVSEMIRTSHIVHKSLLNHSLHSAQSSDLHFGNKLALLGGDYILSKCFHDLAHVKNHDVNELVSSSLRDLTENEFLGIRDAQNFPIPTEPIEEQSKETNLIEPYDKGPYRVKNIMGHCKPEWFLRSILGGANLLGKVCEASCVLTNQDAEMQRNAFFLGKYMGLVWFMKNEVESFKKKQFNNYTLVSAPIYWSMAKHPDLYQQFEIGKDDVAKCNYEEMYQFVKETDAFTDCLESQDDLIKQSHEYLRNFEDNAATQSLNNLLDALRIQ